MSGLQVLAAVAQHNAAAQQDADQDAMARMVDAVPAGVPGPRADREHVPVEMWQALRPAKG